MFGFGAGQAWAVEFAWGGGPLQRWAARGEAEALALGEVLVGNAAFCPAELFAAIVGPAGELVAVPGVELVPAEPMAPVPAPIAPLPVLV